MNYTPRIQILKSLQGLVGSLCDWAQSKVMRSSRDYVKSDSAYDTWVHLIKIL